MESHAVEHQSVKVLGYHGTTLEIAETIKKTKKFVFQSHDWHWLGYGVYFWQDGPLRAFEWALKKARDEGGGAKPAVVCASIDLTDCLDLVDIQYWGIIAKAWENAVKKYATLGKIIPDQVGPGSVLLANSEEGRTAIEKFREAGLLPPKEVMGGPILSDGSIGRYGNNVRDCLTINAAVQLLKEYGRPVSTVRAAFMEGGELFRGSWLRDRSHIQVAVVDPDALSAVISEIIILEGPEIQRKFDQSIVDLPDAGRWTSMSKASMMDKGI